MSEVEKKASGPTGDKTASPSPQPTQKPDNKTSAPYQPIIGTEANPKESAPKVSEHPKSK